MGSRLTRRDFLERATYAGALLVVGARAEALPSGRAPGQMYVSLNGSVAKGVGWPDLARLAARVGFQGVDWSLGPAKTAGVGSVVPVESVART